jgi:hypothetical protein
MSDLDETMGLARNQVRESVTYVMQAIQAATLIDAERVLLFSQWCSDVGLVPGREDLAKLLETERPRDDAAAEFVRALGNDVVSRHFDRGSTRRA